MKFCKSKEGLCFVRREYAHNPNYDDFACSGGEDYVLDFILAQPKDIFIDIGSNVGMHTIRAANAGWKVYAFEPNDFYYAGLIENIKVNKFEQKITPFKIALSDRAETIYLNPEQWATPRESSSNAPDSFELHTRRLDEFLQGEKIGAVKIDTEGYELKILLGMQHLLDTQSPALAIEIHDKFYGYNNLPEITRILTEYGYKIEELGHMPWGDPYLGATKT